VNLGPRGYAEGVATVSRILDLEPVSSFDDYLGRGGGRGLAAAADLGPSPVVELVATSGLRGRGGAGFPTGVKWRTVAAGASAGPATVVVNAAEGEPGTFKDRTLIRRNPYRILEGALVAAYAMAAPRVVVVTKASFTTEVARFEAAIAEFAAANVATDVSIELVGGPDSYLFGEETALLEVVDGRQPFPRVAPPYRQGLDPNPEARVLVDNVETLANVPGIVAEGAGWFRSVGTARSPGTIVCTVSGDALRHGVAEFEMGTPLREVIETIGHGPLEDRHWIAAVSGTANAIITADQFDTPMCYEAMAERGSGLGTGGLIMFDDSRDLIDVGHAVAHFLAVESCGQCEPCKLDGQAIAVSLGELVTGRADASTIDELRRRVGTVARGARCALARQQEAVIGDLLIRCADQLEVHAEAVPVDADPVPIAPIVDLVDERFVLDDTFPSKQPDWSHDEVDSGKFPVDRLSTEAEPARRIRSQEVAAGAGKSRRDPFAALLELHEAIRADLDTVLGAPEAQLGDATDMLSDHLLRHIELGDRLLYPMLQRVTAAGDDAVWSAELHALDALHVAAELQPGADRRAFDRLANDIRRNLDENERLVFPLLRQHLDESELTDLADAVDEIRAERVVR
jgi:NADH-quinone oxidoreductase subunit F